LVVVSEQGLVSDDCGEDGDSVVVQPPMPHTLVQFEYVFEVAVEGFDGYATSTV